MKTYTIRPLEWKVPTGMHNSIDYVVEAEPMEGVRYLVLGYEVFCPDDKWQFGVPRVAHSHEAAKAACEAHWQRRIEAALVSVEEPECVRDLIERKRLEIIELTRQMKANHEKPSGFLGLHTSV